MSDCIGCGLTKEYREQLRERIEKYNGNFILSACDALALLRQVDELEKEADWLAFVLANAGCGVPLTVYIDESVNGMSPPAPEHWREAVRNAVEENQCKN